MVPIWQIQNISGTVYQDRWERSAERHPSMACSKLLLPPTQESLWNSFHSFVFSHLHVILVNYIKLWTFSHLLANHHLLNV